MPTVQSSYLKIISFSLYTVIAFSIASCNNVQENTSKKDTIQHAWYGWNKYQLKESDSLARYGYQLISNTAYYLGPKGIKMQMSNGMNCQNCHLEAGIIPWGNNFSAVASTYPKFRDRSGSVESIEKRVNDCFERSLNGKAIDSAGKEMRAIVAYIKWVGNEVPKGIKPQGSGIMNIAYLNQAADAVKGKLVYMKTCSRCHGNNGEGQLNIENYGYTYPPLWGSSSYNTGAGLNRLSRLAGYIKNNMPFNEADYMNTVLTNEEAWNVAAFITTQARPVKDVSKDWPDISKKPFDYPYAPYIDSFSEQQHQFGPFKPIVDYYSKRKK